MLAIEVKSTETLSKRDVRGLIAFGEEAIPCRRIVVCEEKRRRLTEEGIEVWPVEQFFKSLWNREFDSAA